MLHSSIINTQPRLEINLRAVQDNYMLLRKKAKSSVSCAAAVKANAYGLGACNISKALFEKGCRDFFVANLEEGAELRAALCAASKIYVLNGFFKGQGDDFLENDLIPVLNDLGQVQEWQNFLRQQDRKAKAVMHFDTGMGRLGLAQKEWQDFFDSYQTYDAIDFCLAMSHLACADERDHPKNKEQLVNLQHIKSSLKNMPFSFANSSGVFLGTDYHFDLLRPGYALYGGNPTPLEENPMRAVVTMSAPLLQIKEIHKNASIGYGAVFKAKENMRIGILAIGYADGLFRSFFEKGFVFVKGCKAKILGRISMDLIAIDLTNLYDESINPGMFCEILNETQTIDDVANQTGVIGYEILTHLGLRFKRYESE